MYISKFEAKSFRCFIGKQILSFAIPKNNKVGSGLTFLVGENNSGKTSLLEAMKFSAADNNIDSSTLRSSDILNPSIRFAFYDINSKVTQQLSLLHEDALSVARSIRTFMKCFLVYIYKLNELCYN